MIWEALRPSLGASSEAPCTTSRRSTTFNVVNDTGLCQQSSRTSLRRPRGFPRIRGPTARGLRGFPLLDNPEVRGVELAGGGGALASCWTALVALAQGWGVVSLPSLEGGLQARHRPLELIYSRRKQSLAFSLDSRDSSLRRGILEVRNPVNRVGRSVSRSEAYSEERDLGQPQPASPHPCT